MDFLKDVFQVVGLVLLSLLIILIGAIAVLAPFLIAVTFFFGTWWIAVGAGVSVILASFLIAIAIVFDKIQKDI